MATVTTSANALKKIANWNIDPRDKGAEFVIDWDHERILSVGVRMSNGELSDATGDYRPDYETWTSEDLPALQEANELENEDYA